MRKIKKAMRVILPITVIVIAVILIVNSQNLSKLMGNSVTEYYCEDSSYTLDGTNCAKLIKEKANVLGDIYVDGIVDIKDVTELNKLINENKFVETADINEDEMLDERDVNILQRFLIGDPIVSTTGITYDYIGKKKVCAKDYTLNGDYCEKTDVVKAIVRTIDNPVEIIITDDQNGNTDIKNDTKVTLDVKFKVNHTDKKYYYMLKIYESDKQISQSACLELKEEIIKQDLNLSYGKGIKGIYNVYSNAYCNVIVDRFETKLYKLDISSNVTVNNEQTTDINAFTIKYNSNGGLGSMSDQKIIYNIKTPTIKNTFTKKGYVFNGWRVYNNQKRKWICYLNKDKTTQDYTTDNNYQKYGYVVYKNGANVSRTAKPGETITFYAQWTNQFTIKYNSNGGTGSMNNQKVTYGNKVSLNKNKFIRSNYYFNGWRMYNETKKQWICYLNSEKSKQDYTSESTCRKYGYVVYKNGANVAKTAKPGETISFRAQWIYNYKKGIQEFNGFEKDPIGATIWPMKHLTIYKNNNGSGSTNKIAPQGTALKILDMTNKNSLNNSYVKVKYNGITGWIDSRYVMINLPDVIPSIIYSIRNADSSIFKNNNKTLSSVTGKNLYGTSWFSYNKRLGRNEYLAPIRMSTAKKIQRAQSTALKYGNKLKIYDLYRPWDAQLKVKNALDKVLFTGNLYCIPSEFDVRYSSNGSSVSCITDSKGWFIAQNPSSHNMAKAIDVTLVTSDDNSEIKMQSNMHELSRLSVPTDSNLQKYPAEIALNKLFVGVDFKFLLSEWWHFEDDDSRITQTEAKSLSKKTLKLAN